MGENDSMDGTAWDVVERVFREKGGNYYRFAYSIVKEEFAAGDIVQNAFLKVLENEKLRGYDERRLNGYLMATVHNMACDHFKRQRDAPGELEESVEGGVSPEEAVLRAFEHEGLYRSVMQLDERQRYAIFMKYYLEQDNESLSRRLNVKPDSVRSILSRSLRNLRQIMGREDDIVAR